MERSAVGAAAPFPAENGPGLIQPRDRGHSFDCPVWRTTGDAMCDKCQELQKKIDRYLRLAFSINDQPTIDQLNQVIKNLEAEKIKLHLDQQR